MTLPSWLNKVDASHHKDATVYNGSGKSNGAGSVDGQVYSSLSKSVIKDRVVASLQAYYEYLFGPGKKSSSGYTHHCPWASDHAGGVDKNPSMSISPVHGGYRCFSCGKTGDVFHAWMKTRSVEFKDALTQISNWLGDPAPPPQKRSYALNHGGTIHVSDMRIYERLKVAKLDILEDARVMNRLFNVYGITIDSVKRFNLGWHNREMRLWIPVYHKGKLANIRKHDILRIHCVWDRGGKVYKNIPDGENESSWSPTWRRDVCRNFGKLGGKVIGIKGHNSVTLYPSQVLGTPKASLDESRREDGGCLCITGGELKAVFLNQMGIPAVSFTGGEGSFTKKWLEKFSGLDVEICLDADEAGVAGAERMAKALTGKARRVRIVHLPDGDVNDYYRSRDWDFSDWGSLPRTEFREYPDEKYSQIPFVGLRDADFFDEDVQFRSVVAGSGETPYFILEKLTASCKRGQVDPLPSCKECTLPACGFESSWEIPIDNVIEFIGKSPKKQEKHLIENVAGIPGRCPHPEFKFAPRKVQHVGLVQDVDHLRDDPDDEESRTSYYVHMGYFIGKEDVKENEPHKCFGKIIQDPKDSTATLIIREMRPVKRSFENALLSSSVSGTIGGFPGHNEDLAGVTTRIGFFARQLGDVIAQIYEQRDLVVGSLLTWFMPIRFKLFDKWNEKIGAEALFIGDSRAGKTSINKTMLKHFRAGRFISCEGATFAGLVGGADAVGSKRFFTWGALPTQDQGMVVLDEIDDIVRSGVFSKLTSIRSDGVASRTIAGGLRQCSSRLRMNMLTNPLSSRRMKSYSSAMFAINDLISSPQDVARFEYAIGVYRDDDPAVYNRKPLDEPVRYTQSIASEHVRWGWRQRPIIDGDLAQYVLDSATELSKNYVGLALLPSSEARWKVARIACAVAAICCSYDSSGNVDVLRSHVDYAKYFLDSIYGSEGFAYHKFVGRDASESEEVKAYMNKLGIKAIEYIYYNDSFTTETIDIMVVGMSNRQEFLKILHLDNTCLTKRRSYFYKSDGFKELLEKIRNARGF